MVLTIENAKILLNRICKEHLGHDSEIMQSVEGERLHALDVLSWVEYFDSNASLSLKLAALFHDIDRVVNPKMGGGFKGDRNSNAYILHKKNHAKRSVDFIIPTLVEIGYPIEIIENTKFLILHHDDIGKEVEQIGNSELNHLVAADCFAFFTSIAPRLNIAEGTVRLKDKIRFMVDKLPENTRLFLRNYRLKNDAFETLKNEIISIYYKRRIH